MPRLSAFGGASARAFGLNGVYASPGQIEWTTSQQITTWTVPAGVTRVSGVAVGGGGQVGHGGGLHWRNNIAVTPGEVLSVQIGTMDRLAGSAETFLKRGATYLLRADANSYFGTLGGGGGNGGSGAVNNATIGGGGAGGYMGDGGSGGGGTSNPPAANSGGGASGVGFADGGGVGLQGRDGTFSPGSLGTPKCGGGCGEGQVGGPGGLRLMWGNGRSYPDAAVNV